MDSDKLKEIIRSNSLEKHFGRFISNDEKGSDFDLAGVKLRFIEGERENEYYNVVFSHVDSDTYYSIQGSYDSQDGVSYWGGYMDFHQVKSVEKTITVWKSV